MNEWRNKHPGKILLVLTCLKKGNEERKKKEKSHQRMGWIRKKEKEKEKKKEKKKLMMQVQAVRNAGTGCMVASRLFTVSR